MPYSMTHLGGFVPVEVESDFQAHILFAFAFVVFDAIPPLAQAADITRGN